MTTLVFDTETTGLPLHPNARMSAQPYIIEWGGALVNSKGEILETLGILIKPGFVTKEKRGNLLDAAGVKRISGIEVDDLLTEPTFAEVVEQILPFFAKADQVIAHNLPFDKSMMEIDLERIGLEADWPWPKIQTCTVQEHKEEFGRFPKMTELYEHYMDKPLAQTHRALDDVMTLVDICRCAEVL